MKCGSITPELLDAAQWYWNFVKSLTRRDPANNPTVRRPLTECRIWRLQRALEECVSAWRELAKCLMNPNNLAILSWQESAATRKIMTISVLQAVDVQSGANFSLDEVREQLAAVQPPYTRDDNCVVTLRDALDRLSTAENTVVSDCDEGKSETLPCGLPFDLATAMGDASGTAPRCHVVHNGMPVFDG
ncbi:hypothetical protein IL306_015242 [Fusarium sp. DS 682]|nr:hypothetical protein IL306_015242 [Fusarium sp. DS 682]